MISPESSVLTTINGFDIHYYGVIMFVAMLAGFATINNIAKKYYKDINIDFIIDIMPTIIIFSLIGARLYYVLMDFDYFAQHKSEIFAVWHGGMSIHGGIIGGILSGLIISKLNKIPFLKYADIFSYGLIIGQAIGRFGNYFNCEAFGKPCYIPYLKLYIPEQYRPYGYEQFSYFHPTFLYESIWNIIVFFLLFFVIRKLVQIKNLKEGTIFFSYLILYSTGRFFIEWCRLDSIKNIYGLHIAQVVSIATIIIATICLLYRNKVRA